MAELASLTPGRSGADIEAICRRASLLALREWISPKLALSRVQVTEAAEEEDLGGDRAGTTAMLRLIAMVRLSCPAIAS